MMYMDTAGLQRLAERNRARKETGMALLAASALLALFLFIPVRSPLPLVPAVATATTTASAFENLALTAHAAIVYDLATGETLYAKNADAQLPLASLTKLLTVYTALSILSPTTPITIPDSVTALTPPRAFNAGQVFSLGDLARLTLVASLNDGAVAMAETAARQSNQSPQEALAGAAAALDLYQTYALNGSGLDMSEAVSGGYGSARDLARLAGALVSAAPTIALATTKASAEATSEGGTHFTVKNTDPIVGSIPHLLLSKTGLTDLAGGNLALVFDAGIEHPVAVVVLGSSATDRFTDGAALIEATFAHFAEVSPYDQQ